MKRYLSFDIEQQFIAFIGFLYLKKVKKAIIMHQSYDVLTDIL